MSEVALRFLMTLTFGVGSVIINLPINKNLGGKSMEDKMIPGVKGTYNKSKYKTRIIKSFPKNDGSGRWIVGDYAISEDNTEILISGVECDKERVPFVSYLISK